MDASRCSLLEAGTMGSASSNSTMTRSEEPPRYIVVDGPIGVGKTTLARRLAESLQAELMLEQAEQNPFLERFYRDPVNAALPAQLFFLLERARCAQSLRQ